MKKIFVFAFLLFFQIFVFSQNKVINLTITIDKKIIRGLSVFFIVSDTIKNKNDTIQASYYPGHLSMRENDFNIIVEHKNVMLVFEERTFVNKGCENRDNATYISSYYRIKYLREWFSSTYLLLDIYTQGSKEYREKSRDNVSDKYTYEVYTPDGYVLIRANRK